MISSTEWYPGNDIVHDMVHSTVHGSVQFTKHGIAHGVVNGTIHGEGVTPVGAVPSDLEYHYGQHDWRVRVLLSHERKQH